MSRLQPYTHRCHNNNQLAIRLTETMTDKCSCCFCFTQPLQERNTSVNQDLLVLRRFLAIEVYLLLLLVVEWHGQFHIARSHCWWAVNKFYQVQYWLFTRMSIVRTHLTKELMTLPNLETLYKTIHFNSSFTTAFLKPMHYKIQAQYIIAPAALGTGIS